MRTLPSRHPPAAQGPPAAPARQDPAFARVTAVAAVSVLACGSVGLLWLRHWGSVPFSVPSVPYYFAFPFYLFPYPRLDPGWALVALPVALAAAAGVVVLARSELPWAARLALSCAGLALLALAVAALREGPHGWWAPLDSSGEYPAGVAAVEAAGGVAGIPGFLRSFPQVLPSLPTHAQAHPAGAMVFYALVARVHPGLPAAALATVAVGALGALAAGALARDELGEAGGRLALALWALSPGVVLYVATSADAVFAAVLAGAAVAAHRGLARRSRGWTLTGGALLWLGTMLSYAVVLLLPFLAVRAAGVWLRAGFGRVGRWALLTAAVVLGLTGLLWLLAGYDPVAAVRSAQRAYQAAPGSAGRSLWQWAPGDLVAFGGMLGVPLLAALTARMVAVVRERAWVSLDAAAAASLLAAASWGFSKGEVERIFQFLVPLVLVAAVRQLRTWRVRLPVVAALLLAQTLLVQVLFATRW